MSKYSLMINFETLEELTEFITIYNKINMKNEIKTIKTTHDKRGSKTIGLHLKAKEFRMLHPELSYRNCLIEVSKQVSKPEEPIELIDEIPEPYIEVFEDVINI